MRLSFWCLNWCLLPLLFSVVAHAQPTLSVLAELMIRPGNPAITPDERIFFSNHPFDKPEFKLMRLKDGGGEPYPNPEFSRDLASVIGITADREGILWVLEMGSEQVSPKLIGWNTQNNSLHAVHVIPKEVRVSNSFLQDVVIDEKHDRAYIADMGLADTLSQTRPAFIVIDLNTGQMRRVLERHKSMMPEPSAPMRAEGQVLKIAKGEDTLDVVLGLNPIGIDSSFDWLYFSTMQPGVIHRIPTNKLSSLSLDEKVMASFIEPVAEKASSDGMVVSPKGEIFITDVDNNAIQLIDPQDKKTNKIFFKHQRLIWPDALAVNSSGELIVTVNQLNRLPQFNAGQDKTQPPFLIVKVSR